MEPHSRPPADAVAYRSLALVSLLFRNNLERALASEQRPRGVVERLNTLLLEWMDREGVRARLSKRERSAMETPLGGWEERGVAELSWRIEAVGALLWSVGLVPAIAPYDTMSELDEVIPGLGVFESSAPLMTRLRAQDERAMSAQRDIAEIWHWRARTAELQRRSGLLPAPQNLQSALERARAAGAFDAIPTSGDLLAFGKPYRDLSVEELTTCAAIARERHHALNWACGRSTDWDDTAADT